MNCADCRDNLAACIEGQLDSELAHECFAHLSLCAECRAEYAAIAQLQGQLVESGRSAAGVTMVGPVMRQIRELERKPENDTLMNKLLSRWGLGWVRRRDWPRWWSWPWS